ncbi:MAG TPA: transglutaminase domain-containing protein [Spirochaetota bacterium]|nr:transglutaminase domain-containing protein [Spirochaetota bacterium]
MKNLENKKYLFNNYFYVISSIFLYSILFFLFSLKLKDFYNPVAGTISLFFTIVVDYYLSKRRIRIFFRLLLVILFLILITFFVNLFSLLVSSTDRYNIFDKIPYLFRRDIFIATLFLVFYFFFDGIRVIKNNRILYFISTILLIIGFGILLNLFDLPITKTIYKNYFNYSLLIIFIVLLFIVRHMSFNQNLINRKFQKRDLFLLLLLFIPIIMLLFSITLQNFIKENNKGNSGLFNQSLFNFDFSNFIELKDEIKMSEDLVLIMELNGFTNEVTKRISEGWNRQIYIKRFSLEEYTGRGGFKTAENYVDQYSSPVYVSNYKWRLRDKPKFKDRIDVLQTMYLINIDSSSLLGADLLYEVVPLTNWEGSPYKQIYNSLSYVSDTKVTNLFYDNPSQKKFLENLHPERKKLLLEWGKNEKIRDLAIEITKGYDNLLYKVLAIQQYLLDNYYYSLKPGLAKGMSQLEYFLFETKKGYCSYFAFAMTVMLRSIGIASRVAVGFAPDMNNHTLNFYHIRSIDAHAWVEVYFDDYGWITFDPTSSEIAPGESYDFAMFNQEENKDYIEQILKNKDKIKEITNEKNENKFLEDLKFSLKTSVRWFGILLFIILVTGIIFLIFTKKYIYFFLFLITKDYRKKNIYLYKYFLTRLIDYGYGIEKQESILEFADRLKKNNIVDIIEITKNYQKAIFKERDNFNINPQDFDNYRNNFKKELKKFKTSRRIKALFNISTLWKKILPLILIVFVINNIYSDDIKLKYNYNSLDEYIYEAKIAINSNYFDKALEILNEAEKIYKDSYRPNLEKGILYNNHTLYENAIIEFLKVKNKGYVSEEFYTDLANCYGKIGEDKKAVKIFEEAYQKLPYKSVELYDNMGWMYFKIHELNKGINIVNEGLKKYPKSSDLFMTLGTLYSEAWDYNKSKEYYLKSVENSFYDFKASSFRSIAMYNLSLLEHAFLYYQNAYDACMAAISYRDRSTPHLELTYLYSGALELKNAYNEIKRGSILEPKTLFPDMALSYNYINAGKIDEAINLINALLKIEDFEWMLYFGTNRNAYYAELYRYLSIAYEFKANIIKATDNLNNNIFLDMIRPLRRLFYRFLSLLYNFRSTNLLIGIGEDKIKGGSNLEGLHQLYTAYERVWPAKALKVLLLSEKEELRVNPNKKRIYEINKAIIKKKGSFFYSNKEKAKILKENIKLLDRRWEKEILATALVELINATNGKEKDNYIVELFLIHSPYIVMNNFNIKMNIIFSEAQHDFLNKNRNKIMGKLNTIGIKNSSDSRLTLNIRQISQDKAKIVVSDKDKVVNSYDVKISFNNNKNSFVRLFCYEIYKTLFTINMGE